MLGLDNPVHILFLLALLLLVFGAKRLPEMGRSLGSGLRGFKDSLSGDPVQPASIEQHSATVQHAGPARPAGVQSPANVPGAAGEPGATGF